MEPSVSGVESSRPGAGRWRNLAIGGALLAGIVGGLAGWIGSWRWLWSDPSNKGIADIAQLEVPGSGTVTLDTGLHTLYHDEPADYPCDDTDTPGCEHPPTLQRVTIRASETAPPVGLHPTGSSHETIFGVGAYTFTINEPGGYTFTAAGDPATLTVARGHFDPGPWWKFMLLVFGGPALFAASIAAAIWISPDNPQDQVTDTSPSPETPGGG